MDQQLQIFVAVADKKNFSRAADELHMTQPAVSQHIQSLERTMGTKLFERSNKYVRLTEAGEIVYHYARDILHIYKQMQRVVDDLTQIASGTLAIGASYTFGEYILPHVIAAFRGVYPSIIPSIVIHNTTEIAQQVVARNLDVGIVEGEFLHPDLVIEEFADDTMVVIVSKDNPIAVGKRQVTSAELENETWILRERGSGTRENTERLFAASRMMPKTIMEFSSTQVIKEAVEAGLGIALVSEWTIHKEERLGTLRVLKLEDYHAKRKFSIVTHKSKFRTKAVDLFLEYLKTQGLSSLETMVHP